MRTPTNKKKAIEDYKIALIDEAYHRKQMEYYQEKVKVLERYLNIDFNIKKSKLRKRADK